MRVNVFVTPLTLQTSKPPPPPLLTSDGRVADPALAVRRERRQRRGY
jgi:hypothetical protein